MSDTLVIDLYVDYVCPWCYLSSANVARLEREEDVVFRWHGFPLHPDTPAEGLSLESLFGGRDMSAAHARLEALMREAGLDYAPDRDKTYNSRLAQELGLWAGTLPGGEALHGELYRAYFVRKQNLAQEDVLLEAVENAGLDRDEAAAVLRERRFQEALDRDWQQARQLGLGGVPAFIAEGYLLSGSQPYPELLRFVTYVKDLQARQ